MKKFEGTRKEFLVEMFDCITGYGGGVQCDFSVAIVERCDLSGEWYAELSEQISRYASNVYDENLSHAEVKSIILSLVWCKRGDFFGYGDIRRLLGE